MPYCETAPLTEEATIDPTRLKDFSSGEGLPLQLPDCNKRGRFELKIYRQDQMNADALPRANSLQDFIISGVLDGWQKTFGEDGLSSLDPDSFWRILPFMDTCMITAGQGQVARIAFCWYFILMSKFLYTSSDPHDSSALPCWWMLRREELLENKNSLSNHMAWPKVRQRMSSSPERYSHWKFARDLMNASRFIWPFSVASAVTKSLESGERTFSGEFALRLDNIRSFALSKEFLDKYPQFIGDAPQLEPSLSLVQPQTSHRLDNLYWRMLREARERRLRRPAQRDSAAQPTLSSTLPDFV